MSTETVTALLLALMLTLLAPAPYADAGQDASLMAAPQSTIQAGGTRPMTAGQTVAEAGRGDDGADFWAVLRRTLVIFFLLSGIALVLLIGTVIFLLWRAKLMVENAIKTDLPSLERLVGRVRAKHPGLSVEALAKKLIHRQANRAGLVGLVTGIGGLPLLPFAIPIDIAASVKLQSNLVQMLRIIHSGGHSAEEVSRVSLWLITSGGHELTAASGALIRNLLVKALSKSLLKFLPLIGGVVGFALNWTSTQALGRLSLKWLNRAPETAADAEQRAYL